MKPNGAVYCQAVFTVGLVIVSSPSGAERSAKLVFLFLPFLRQYHSRTLHDCMPSFLISMTISFADVYNDDDDNARWFFVQHQLCTLAISFDKLNALFGPKTTDSSMSSIM